MTPRIAVVVTSFNKGPYIELALASLAALAGLADFTVIVSQVRAEREGVSVDEARRKSEKAIPIGRYGTVDEFGRAAAFLLSDAASYITGSSLALDGGALRSAW